MQPPEVEPKHGIDPCHSPWLMRLWAAMAVSGAVLLYAYQHERTKRRLAEDRLDILFRLEDFAYSVANTPEAPDARRLQESNRCAIAAISLAQAHPQDDAAARLIYRLAGEMYFVIGIGSSSPDRLVNSQECFRQLHLRGGTEDSGVALRSAEVLHEIGMRLAGAHFDNQAISCFLLAMQIGHPHVKRAESESFQYAYGRSYDALVNHCVTGGIADEGAFLDRVDEGFRETVDLWTHLKQKDPNSPTCKLGLAASHFNYAQFLLRMGQPDQSSENLRHTIEILKPCNDHRAVLLRAQAIAFRTRSERRDGASVEASMAELRSCLELLMSNRDMSAVALIADLQRLARNLQELGLRDEAATLLRQCNSMVEQNSNSFERPTGPNTAHKAGSSPASEKPEP